MRLVRQGGIIDKATAQYLRSPYVAISEPNKSQCSFYKSLSPGKGHWPFGGSCMQWESFRHIELKRLVYLSMKTMRLWLPTLFVASIRELFRNLGCYLRDRFYDWS